MSGALLLQMELVREGAEDQALISVILPAKFNTYKWIAAPNQAIIEASQNGKPRRRLVGITVEPVWEETDE